MSELRRRIFGTGDSTPISSREASPAPTSKDASGAAYKLVPQEKLDQLKTKVKTPKGRKRRNFWIFALGGIFGILTAGFFAARDGALDQLVTLAGLEDMNLDTLLDVLPRGVIRDVRDLQVCWSILPGIVLQS